MYPRIRLNISEFRREMSNFGHYYFNSALGYYEENNKRNISQLVY